MSEYRPRLADKELSDALRAFGAVLITGPKWSGKTTTASRIAASVLKLQDPDTKERNLALARLRPSTLLKGDNPRLIDEWQEAHNSGTRSAWMSMSVGRGAFTY